MATTLAVAEIEEGIDTIVKKGQSFTLDGVTYNRANLSALITLLDNTRAAASRSDGSRPVLRGVKFSGMGY